MIGFEIDDGKFAGGECFPDLALPGGPGGGAPEVVNPQEAPFQQIRRNRAASSSSRYRPPTSSIMMRWTPEQFVIGEAQDKMFRFT